MSDGTASSKENAELSFAEGETSDHEDNLPAPFQAIGDNNPSYVEEEAHIYHNPPLPSYITQGVLPRDLPQIPPPPPVPEAPNTGKCKWSYNEDTRVYLADFSVQDQATFAIDPKDERFMLDVMERDDITLVSQGLLDMSALDHNLWSLDNIGASLDQEFFHRFRRFDTRQYKNGTEKIEEIDVLYAMQMMDYRRYLDQREGFLTHGQSERRFDFTDNMGKEHSIDVVTSALYMIDLDLYKFLPSLGDNFRSAFRYPSALPGGHYCMMNKVTPSARPFMGPNRKLHLFTIVGLPSFII